MVRVIHSYSGFLILLFLSSFSWAALPISESINQWLDTEFVNSTLTREQQEKELLWFHRVSEPLRGMSIRVVSERIDTHWYEANVLTKAFEDITGIQVIHEITGEDDVIKKISTQMALGYNLYDAYINDSDLIGTHFRSDNIMAISDLMAQHGKDFTLPTLDLDDFIGLAFTTGPNGKIYQLPDQQFANLYWYRHDWFSREDFQEQFKSRYGYDLAVPQNWAAYEDIAEFFTMHVKEIDGVKVYGHMDYGKNDPSLGWRFSDAWLSMAGAGDKGLPNGLPVDEWGIRVENCSPVGASVSRGGALNSPAAKFALTKYIEWLDKYAPPDARNMNFSESGAVAAQGAIAQQIFWYTAFTADFIDPTLPVTDEQGRPKWRMAPSPRGPYWESGMKSGYQDNGAWTFLTSTPVDRQQAAWLYAQFVVSKTVSLQKMIKGLTPIRQSDIESDYMSKAAPNYGGLIEFYRSSARLSWTPTGTNVPDYPSMSKLWWQNIASAVSGKMTAEQAMDNLAEEMDSELKRLMNNAADNCQPKLNDVSPESTWLEKPGSPKPKLENEKPKGETLPYVEALQRWEIN
ncbi:ABC transporter substrate-binding protein [Reinekea sp. G2M2-21]|uniref:ABC transporter substrate-binding protein n=1 Tax=Reinekea sp. G2M2-21 TaxID=2788942 RepID=UPI0018AB561B